MAIAAITIDDEFDLGGTALLGIGTFTPDSSWLAAGEVIDITGRGTIRSARFESKGGYIFRFDKASQSVLAYYGDNNNAADGPLIAVPDTTDISAIGPVE